MLRSTFYSFTTALRGLNTAQKQLDVTGQNISNVSTTGYTRQRADIYSAAAGGYGDRYGTRSSTMVGQGVIVGSISQSRDQFLDVRYRREAANLGEQGAKLDTMNDLSLVFDEIESKGLMTSFNDFVTKLQSLAGNADSSEFDSIARDAASTLVKQFNQYARQISTVREEKEYNLKEVTGKTLNDLMTNISELNKSIRNVQCNGGPALELKDERNLLLDQLSDYMKIDVKYTPKEVAGGIVVEDVSISMVGEDGSKQPLIYNDAAATFNVKTKGVDGADRAIVTIDNSALPAKETLTQINDLLQSISISNTSLQNVNNALAKLYPNDASSLPAGGPLDYTRLPAKITAVTDSITATGGLDDQITTATTAVADAQTALDTKLADTANPPTAAQLQTLRKAISDAVSAKDTLVAKRQAALKEKDTLTEYNNTATEYVNGITSCDTKLKGILSASPYNITATQNYLIAGDFTSCYYTFKDAGGNDIKDSNGNPIKWNTGGKCTQLDRDGLAQIGVKFTDNFDAEKLASPGSLKGAIDMLNSEGVFDYKANETRGIGYYESMLDSLADKLASTLNKLNDKEKTTTKENLFETSDGSSQFTASNLKIADGWLNGKYGVTATKQTQVGSSTNSGQNDNILLMISTISSKLNYSTGPVPNKDANGNYLKTAADGTTSIVANGRDSNGNYTLNGALVSNKDMVNFKSIALTPSGTDYVDVSGHVYTKTADNVFVYDDGTNKIAVNSDGILYKGDGTTGEHQLDANMLSATPANSNTYLAADGLTAITNGKDANGNYTLNGALVPSIYKSKTLTPSGSDYTDSDGHLYTNTGPNIYTYTDGSGNITAVNSSGLLYEGNGSTGKYQLDSTKLPASPASSNTYIGSDGVTVLANGKDVDGNYTMTTTDVSGKKTIVTVANADGVLYKTEPDGSNSKDKDGNLILDTNSQSKLDYRSQSFLYKGTFGEYLANIANVLSLDVSSTSNLSANHETILKSIQTAKDGISTVSLDEEGVSIMQYQKAYNAAARLMTALDESVERIINQMGTVGR
nr:flagellar basal body protein [uncultured Aminipila sp.]